MCDECGKRLGFRKGWFHCVGDVFDLCKRDYELLGDEDKKDATYKRVLQKDDLAGDLTVCSGAQSSGTLQRGHRPVQGGGAGV